MIDGDRVKVGLGKHAVRRVRSRPAAVIVAVISLLASILFTSSSVSAATHYYVDVNGSDSNPGTSSLPWRTIQKAANTMVGGDTVHVRAGTFNERVQVTRSGSSGAPVTYLVDGAVTMKGFTVRANFVSIRGFTITNTPNHAQAGVGIYVEGSYCTIENNYVTYATRGGIQIYARPGEWSSRSNCIVRNNRLYRNSQWGIEFHGRNHLIEGNEIWRTIQHHPAWTSPPGWLDADGMRFFGSGHTVRANYTHDIRYADTENVNPHIDCFQTWADDWHEGANNTVFERNLCRVLESQAPNENAWGFMLAGASYLTIRNNVFQTFGHVNAYAPGNHHLTVVGNTLTSSLSFPADRYPSGINLNNCPYSTIRNNVFYDLNGPPIVLAGTSGTGLQRSDNLAYRTDGRTPSGTPGPGDLWGVNPQFVNPGADNFHLQPSSPAVDSGYNLGSLCQQDYDGVSRPQQTDFDMGALEYWTPGGGDWSVYLPEISKRR